MMRAPTVVIMSLLPLAVSVLLFACAVKPAVTVTDVDNGTKVEIQRGDFLAVKLEAQLGTGYGWKVVSGSEVLILKGEPEQVSKEGHKPGGPDIQTFKFKAVKKGETTLRLQYIEAWKKKSNPLKEYSIAVTVE